MNIQDITALSKLATKAYNFINKYAPEDQDDDEDDDEDDD
jgi:hypothetical protein